MDDGAAGGVRTRARCVCGLATTRPDGRPLGRAGRNAASGATRAGLLLARAARAELLRVDVPGDADGVVVAGGCRWVRRPFTVGDVVLTRLPAGRLAALRDGRLVAHEAVHAEQWARLGPVRFLLAYAVATAWSLLRTGSPGCANRFEVEAGLVDGGYRC